MKNILFILAIIALGSCQRMDSFLYNNDNKITAYERDNFKGEVDFILDSTYNIPSNLISELVLQSQTKDEKEPTDISAIYIGNIDSIKSDTVILYCHGNKWHMDFYWQRAKLMAHIGGKNRYGVMMMDYRGFGLSKGKPTEEGMYADVDATMKWLKAKGLTNERLIIYGFSLGSAATCELTANPRTLTPSKVILEAPFASAAVMVQTSSKLALSSSFFTDLKIDNAEEIKKINQPLLWIHGIDDHFLSMVNHGEVVYKNYKGSYSEAHRIPGADHGEVPEKTGFQEYLTIMQKFIAK